VVGIRPPAGCLTLASRLHSQNDVPARLARVFCCLKGIPVLHLITLPSLFNLYFAGGLGLAWLVVYFAWLRPWLKTYQRTAGIMVTIEADEAKGLKWLGLKLKGAWTAILLFVTSILTGGWGLIEALFGVDPSALAPFQESALWKGLLQDEMALRAAAIATFAGAVLVLKGKLHDVKIVPAAAPVAAVSPVVMAPVVAPTVAAPAVPVAPGESK
jgi:hypothetical protein